MRVTFRNKERSPGLCVNAGAATHPIYDPPLSRSPPPKCRRVLAIPNLHSATGTIKSVSSSSFACVGNADISEPDLPEAPARNPPSPRHHIDNESLLHPRCRVWCDIAYSLHPAMEPGTNACGQVNLGNTCYINALVAALSYCAPVQQYCVEHSLICSISDMSHCPACALAADSSWLHTSRVTNLAPSLATNRHRLHVQFANNRQHDAHAAFCSLADVCHDVDWNAFKSHSNYQLRNEATLYTTPWWQLFLCVVRTTVSCSHCASTMTKHEPLRGLSVELVANVARDLQPLLLQFNSEVPLPDYKCDRCNLKDTSKKTTEILTSPPILLIHFKRWFHDEYLVENKNKDHVTLDFSLPWHASIMYTLTAVVVHEGEDNAGHYVAFVRQQNGTWFRYDDSHPPEIVSCETVGLQQAYLAFYVR